MDSIDLNGKEYISSKQAAKLTGYAQDYVGQLARGEKVPGTRVGRSWYVDKQAILSHAGVASQDEVEPKENTTSTSHTVEKTVESPSERAISISPNQIQTKPLHSLQKNNMHPFKTWSTVQYLEDSSDLLPSLQEKSEENRSVQVRRITNENIDNSSKVKSVVTKSKSSQASSKKEVISNIKQTNLALQKTPFGLIGAISVMFLLILGALSGMNTSDSWVFEGSQQVASVGTPTASNPFEVVFLSLKLFFFEGISLLVSFVSFFLSSAESFFDLGVSFIKGFFK